MTSNGRIVVAVADPDPGWRRSLSLCLEQAGCSVVPCPDLGALHDALARPPTCGRPDLVVASCWLHPAGASALEALDGLGGVPLLVTVERADGPLERRAMAAGASVVCVKRRDGISGVVQAARHLIEQTQRWGGRWISTGLLRRPDAEEAKPDSRPPPE